MTNRSTLNMMSFIAHDRISWLRLSLFAIVLLLSTDLVAAPPERDAPSADPSLDTRGGVVLLSGVKDGTFAFDDEGFYWFCQFLRKNPDALAESDCNENDIVPWQYLMERPSDYRGQPVCIEGRFLLEQPAYDIATRPELGRLRQWDIGVAGSNAIATLVLVDPAPRTKKRSLIRVRGFFIKIRSFRTESGEEGAGPLFVARSVEILETPDRAVPQSSGLDGRDLLTAMAGIVVVLFFLSVIVRRRVSRATAATSASFERPRTSGTNADFQWMDENSAAPPRGDDSSIP